MFEGFEVADLEVEPGVTIHHRVGGEGPPLLLLHGNPQTHVSWHAIAPQLAERFTVVAADLRGYGDSSAPEPVEGHRNYSFRAMAQDQVTLMRHLGFDRFAVAGHDRGARVVHRMCLDHPDTVTRTPMQESRV
jgi:haloacetate dehalogenase